MTSLSSSILCSKFVGLMHCPPTRVTFCYTLNQAGSLSRTFYKYVLEFDACNLHASDEEENRIDRKISFKVSRPPTAFELKKQTILIAEYPVF